MKAILLATGAALCLATFPAYAQPKPAEPVAPASAPPTVSLSRYLQLQSGQMERLDRIYSGYASRRREQENKMAVWQDRLRGAQAPTSFNEKEATRLQREIGDAQQKAVADLIASRAKALAVLPPVQRSQLQALANDPRFEVAQNAYYELLLMPVEEVWDSPADRSEYRGEAPSREQRRSESRRDSTSYGVYGGYGYGRPNYGVYGGYGRGGVGVHAGIGRGGPSIGIGIGGIFSGRHW